MFNFVDHNQPNEIYDSTCFLDFDGGFYWIGFLDGVVNVIPFAHPEE